MKQFRKVATVRKVSTAVFPIEFDFEDELSKLARIKARFDKTIKWKTETIVMLSEPTHKAALDLAMQKLKRP